MNEQLKKLYQTIILKNNNEPFNFEKRESAGQVIKAHNQICGDRFTLYFEMDKERITQLSFHGFGCAISKASTSVLVQKLDGKTIDEAKKILKSFLEIINSTKTSVDNLEDDFKAFTATREFPGRITCATLSWTEMSKYLD